MDTILRGLVTYRLFEDYWPTGERDPRNSAGDREIARPLNEANEVVSCRTLDAVHWKDARLVRDLTLDEVMRIREQPGKDVSTPGGAIFAQALINMRLIGEWRLLVIPIIVGAGKPLFRDIRNRIPLTLVGCRLFGSGVGALHCRSAAS